MPSLYTHYRFGEAVYSEMPEPMRDCVDSAKSEYILGLQGPDFLYYGPSISDHISLEFGTEMHEWPMSDILKDLFLHLKIELGKPWGGLSKNIISYLLGFVSHFTLDSYCHPYIYKIELSTAHHVALETDFDMKLLLDEGQKPWEFEFYNLCPVSESVIDTVTTFYAPWKDWISSQYISDSVKQFRSARKLFYTPNRFKLFGVKTLLKTFRVFDNLYGMIFAPPTKEKPDIYNWPDKPKDSMAIIARLMEEAQPIYQNNIQAIKLRLDEGLPLPAFFERNFSMQNKPWIADDASLKEEWMRRLA